MNKIIVADKTKTYDNSAPEDHYESRTYQKRAQVNKRFTWSLFWFIYIYSI
jgi:hypothetical protein